MEILHTSNILGISIPLENIKVDEKEKRDSFEDKTPTKTFPFLETKEGNISQSEAIIYYLVQKHKPELLGQNIFEKAKIMQWTEFANCEIAKCNRSIIFPIFGWDELNKEDYNKDSNKIKEYLKLMENQLDKNEFIIGNKISLADISLFAKIRFLMMFHFPEQMRNKLFPKVSKWFENIMNTKEAVKAYGRTVLCKNPLKPFGGKINKNKHENENKENKEDKEKNEGKKEKDKNQNKKEKKDKKGKKENENKPKEKPKEEKKEKEPYVPGLLEVPRFNIKEIENNPLDSLPQSKFDLTKFKDEFIKSQDKSNYLNNFWTTFDPEGYSLWYIEYNNSANECVTLFRTCVIKGDILEQLKYFRKYCFGVLGAYGGNGAYKIKGCMVWRGNDIPQEIKAINCFNKITLKKLDCSQQKDKELVSEYWTKIDEKEKVFDMPAIDARYFY